MLIEKMNLRNADEMKVTRSHISISFGMMRLMNFCISRFNHIHLNVATFRPQAAQEKRSQGRNIVPWYIVDLVDLVVVGTSWHLIVLMCFSS